MNQHSLLKQLFESICQEMDNIEFSSALNWLVRNSATAFNDTDCFLGTISKTDIKNKIYIFSPDFIKVLLDCAGYKCSLNICDPEFDIKLKLHIKEIFTRCRITELITSI